MEWVGPKDFGVVLESQKRLRTVADAASREATKEHVDTCRNGRTPSEGSGWHAAVPFYNLGLVSTRWNRWLGKVSDSSQIANGGSEQHCMLHQTGIPGSMCPHAECQGRIPRSMWTHAEHQRRILQNVWTHTECQGGVQRSVWTHAECQGRIPRSMWTHVEWQQRILRSIRTHTDCQGRIGGMWTHAEWQRRILRNVWTHAKCHRGYGG
jgi:hypothetical protein